MDSSQVWLAQHRVVPRHSSLPCSSKRFLLCWVLNLGKKIKRNWIFLPAFLSDLWNIHNNKLESSDDSKNHFLCLEFQLLHFVVTIWDKMSPCPCHGLHKVWRSYFMAETQSSDKNTSFLSSTLFLFESSVLPASRMNHFSYFLLLMCIPAMLFFSHRTLPYGKGGQKSCSPQDFSVIDPHSAASASNTFAFQCVCFSYWIFQDTHFTWEYSIECFGASAEIKSWM